MAFRATGYWRSMLTRLGGNRFFATSATPNVKPTPDAKPYNRFSIAGDFAPVCVIMGFVAIPVALALHSLKQQLAHCPNVSLSKKTRSVLPELEYPDRIMASAHRFEKQSLLRKVAHMKDDHRTLKQSDRVHSDPYTTHGGRHADSVKKA